MTATKPVPVTTSDYIRSGDFDAGCAKRIHDANYKTGFQPLDDIQPFYSGFYVLGAVPSLGKTTFALQLADNVAASGRYVLFYSLEQSVDELVSKSLARTLVQMCCEMGFKPNDFYKNPKAPHCYSSYKIRTTHAMDPYVMAAKERYMATVQDRVVIYTSPFGLTAYDVCDDAIEWMNAHPGVKPLIIVDYLQILMASSPTLSDKVAVDEAIRYLKSLQLITGATVFAISSLNRMNYLAELDYSSYKESGGIEYGADAIWGLQLECLKTNKIFTEKSKIGNSESNNSKRTLYKKEKCKPIRDVELACIKNRNGISSYEVSLRYWAEYDIFTWPKGMSWWDDCPIVDLYADLKTQVEATAKSEPSVPAEPEDRQEVMAKLMSKYGVDEKLNENEALEIDDDKFDDDKSHDDNES